MLENQYHNDMMDILPMLLALCPGNQPATGGFPSQRADKPELWYHVFFSFLHVGWNKLLNQQLHCHWFEMPWCLCDACHSNEKQRSFKTSQAEINYWILFYKCMGLDPLINHAEDIYGFYRSFGVIILKKNYGEQTYQISRMTCIL